MAMGNALALSVTTPQINTVANFQASQANAQQMKSQRIAQEAAEFEKWAQVGLGIMGGNPDGEIDQNALSQLLDMSQGDPLAERLKQNPELLRTITKGSLNVLAATRDEARFELAKKQFELQLAESQKPKETTDITEYNFAVANGFKGTFEEWKNSNGGRGADGETFAMQPTYYKVTDPQTGETSVQFGQLGNKGTFKPTALPAGAEPAIPVQQLNTETGFIPVDKFGGKPAGAVETPINNQQAAYDTGVGKGQAEIDVAKPERARKAGMALSALERQTGLVGQDIDKAIAAADDNAVFTTGFLGDLSKAVAGTPAYDLAQTLNTIKANIGFDRLQEMRNNSPTGGALGNVSEKENELLQAVQGATAQGQSAEQFKANLQRIKQLQAEVLAERKAAFKQDFGGEGLPSTGNQTTSTPDAGGDDVVDWTDIDWGD